MITLARTGLEDLVLDTEIDRNLEREPISRVRHEDERKLSAMLILDTETENRGEYPTASQILQSWAARLWAWLRRQPRPAGKGELLAGEETIDGQDCGMGLIL